MICLWEANKPLLREINKGMSVCIFSKIARPPTHEDRSLDWFPVHHFCLFQPPFFTKLLLFLSVLENQILITLALETEGCGWGQGPPFYHVIFLAYFGISISCFSPNQALHRFPINSVELPVPCSISSETVKIFLRSCERLIWRAVLLPWASIGLPTTASERRGRGRKVLLVFLS